MTVVAIWIRRWLLLAVGLPLAAWALDKVRGRVEARRGQTGLTRRLERASGKLRDVRGGRRRRRGW